MLLLVIGLVAVIIAILVTVFLVRRGRADDDEPGGRQAVRDRLRGRDSRLSTDPRAARKPAGRGAALSARPAGEPRGYGGPGRGYEPAGFDQSRGYEPSPRGYGEGPGRGRDAQHTERMAPVRGSGRYQDAPEPATVVSARASRTTSRRAGVATDTGPGPALYDTGPSAGDFAATRANADPDLADSDVFPRVRADIPETEAKTEVKARPKNAAKGRGRPSRGRHDDDDDDWPSTEWDKLSDEQYWAELSADSPLATTARAAHPSTPAPAKPAPAAKPARSAAQPPPPSRAASRPEPALDAGADAPGRRQAADRPGRTGGRQGAPRRSRGANTDPGRPGLADRPGAAAATERLPIRNRREAAAEPLPPSPAPYLPAAPEAGEPDLAGLGPAGGLPPARGQASHPQASRPRADEDPLTSPSFARGAAAAEDSRSYRAPRRSADPRPAQPASGYPGGTDAYPAGYSTSPGGYPADGRDSYPGPARGRDSYDSQARGGYAEPASGYEAYPGPGGGSQDYPASSGRHGYPAGQADRTDPGAAWTDPGGPRSGPGNARPAPGRRRSSTPARQATPGQSPPAAASGPGYPAAPPAPGWGSDRGSSAEAPSSQAGLGNPYGSYVDTTPPAPPAPEPPTAAPARTAPGYQPGQQPANGGSYSAGYTTGPTAAYSDPYGRAPGGYPGTGPQPPADARAEPGSQWYSAPPAASPAAASQPPAAPYPYQPDPGYPGAPDYGTQPGQAGYAGPPPAGSRDDTRYRSGQTDDPYRPDGYSGYHSRQG